MRHARDLSRFPALTAAALAAAAVSACGEREAVVQRPRPLMAAGTAVGAPAVRAARPVRLAIPSLRISTRLERLGLEPDGRLAPPRDPGRAGWWAAGPRPGRRGAAVIAGHIDSRTGPAVFARLARLRRGQRIVVVDRAGRRVRFQVLATRRYAKDAFPTQRVYGSTRGATLRLITCSGAFDRGSGHYTSNLVVFAGLVT